MVRVLFVCLGNICRSPMAEAVFRHHVESRGLKEYFEIDSAGIGDWHVGDAPHKGTQDILREQNITCKDMYSRQVLETDKEDYDYIIGMDEQNMADLESIFDICAGEGVMKLTDFVTVEDVSHVPDPYYTGNFDYTYKLVLDGCKNLLAHIEGEKF